MVIHLIFDSSLIFHYSTDIQFWKNRTSLEGLSVRSVFFNVFQSVIVLLYVIDNDTNTIIKVSVGIGLLIELWKVCHHDHSIIARFTFSSLVRFTKSQM